MSQEMQQAQQTIASLKIRLFDAGEQLTSFESRVNDLQKTLMEIVQVVGIQPAEGAETIALADIVEAVKAIAPAAEVEAK